MAAIGYKLDPIRIVFKLKAELFGTISKQEMEDEEGDRFLTESGINKINRNRFTLMASRKFENIGKFAIFYRIQEDLKGIEGTVSKSIIGFKYSYGLDFTK